MIGEIELEALAKRLENNCDAITVNDCIATIKRQIKEIIQINDQLKNCQRECGRLHILSKNKSSSKQEKTISQLQYEIKKKAMKIDFMKLHGGCCSNYEDLI